MGLGLEVGLLADLEDDPEAEDETRELFDQLMEYTRSVGIRNYNEPEDCEAWSADMFGYSTIHTLRRLAAHVDLTGKLPEPGGIESSKDPILEGYYNDAGQGSRKPLFGLFGRSKSKYSRGFDHLIMHSDAEGYYLPVDFESVLFPPEDFEIPGGMIGSAPRLLKELTQLAAFLEIPPHLNSMSDELHELMDNPPANGKTWQRYAVETYACVTLAEGCRKSIATGAALVFV